MSATADDIAARLDDRRGSSAAIKLGDVARWSDACLMLCSQNGREPDGGPDACGLVLETREHNLGPRRVTEVLVQWPTGAGYQPETNITVAS